MARREGTTVAETPSARALERSLIARLLVANTIAGVVVTTYFALTAHLPPGASRVANFAITAGAFVGANLLM
jgi:hypothetical protein